jgi:hypothetical protein
MPAMASDSETLGFNLSADLEKHCETVFALIASREKITIAEASERTGIPAEIITIILAIYYAAADEVLKLLDPVGQSLH